MPSPKIMAILLLLTLAIASPTTSLEATDSRHLKRQVATTTVGTTTSLILSSIPTITINILQPPYVSLHSITARDAQAPEPTPTPALMSIVPVPITFERARRTSFTTILYQIANVSSAPHHWTEVPVASSASCFTRVKHSTTREWDCKAICGALNEDGECTKFAHCLDIGDGKGKGGRPSWSSSAGRMASSGMVAAIMILLVGVWMLL